MYVWINTLKILLKCVNHVTTVVKLVQMTQLVLVVRLINTDSPMALDIVDVLMGTLMTIRTKNANLVTILVRPVSMIILVKNLVRYLLAGYSK